MLMELIQNTNLGILENNNLKHQKLKTFSERRPYLLEDLINRSGCFELILSLIYKVNYKIVFLE